MSVEIRRPLPTKDFQVDKAIQLLYEEIRKLNVEVQKVDAKVAAVEDTSGDVLFFILKDGVGVFWKITLQENGTAVSTIVGAGPEETILLEDSSTQVWVLGITTGGAITSTNSALPGATVIISTTLGKDYLLGITTGGALITTLQ